VKRAGGESLDDPWATEGGRPVINLGKDGRLPAPFAERQRREGGGWVAMGYRGFSMAQENFVFDPGESFEKDKILIWSG